MQELARRAAHKSFEAFLRMTQPHPNYQYGRHTLGMVHALDHAVKDLENGDNTYLIINLPPRHGKSDTGSRRLPPWALIRNPSWEVILASYNYDLASEMSIDARRCYRAAGPLYDRFISEERDRIGAWRLPEGGALYAAGIGGTVTGRGADVLILDDYFKNRQEAESIVTRDRLWDSFRSDFFTRLAPTHAVIIIANRWHPDDLVGRIEDLNDPKSERYDPNMPKFRKLVYQAQSDDGEWLFPERYSDNWYLTQRAGVSSYAWQAQFQQDPQPRSGNLLRADCVQVVEEMPEGMHWTRAWDLASTRKDRAGEDPSYTVGSKVASRKDKTGALKLYVADVVRGQWEAPERDRNIIKTAAADGSSVGVAIESVAGYKDTYTRIRELLRGRSVVLKVTVGAASGDKVARAECLEAAFEEGNVFIKRAPWNDAWLREMASFPNGRHDDQVDSLVIAQKQPRRFRMTY